jgi:hypothetical protein
MPTVEARRTLVKSPPELWAELSDAEALARRLESLGEIRITRLEPETTVDWEAERARGTVRIEPSGWGTRVTLTAEPSEPSPPAQAPAEEPEPMREAEEPEPMREAEEPAPEPLPQTTAVLGQGFEIQSVPRVARPSFVAAGRVGRFLSARLWWAGGREPATAPPPPPEPSVVDRAPVPDPDPEPDPPEPARPIEPDPVPAADSDADGDAGAIDADALDEVLAAVLDDLGAAHHRPFSRG